MNNADSKRISEAHALKIFNEAINQGRSFKEILGEIFLTGMAYGVKSIETTELNQDKSHNKP